jgi:hypothetical protein
MTDPKNPTQISIELNEEVAQGTYSNLAVITHSASEFVIDFVRIMPGIPKANMNLYMGISKKLKEQDPQYH